MREKQEGLSEQDKASALMVLKDYGEKRWSEKWMSHISFPSTIDVLNDKEDVLRYMLLRALINQQAKVEKARQLPKRLYEEFTETLLYSPWEIDPYRLFDILVDVAGEKGSDLYKVGALGGIKPTSLFLYRFYSFTLYIKTLGNIKLYNIIKNFSSPYGIHMYFKNNTFLSAG